MKMGDMMRQAKKAQEAMEKMQEELAELKIEASAGGGMVKVTATAKRRLSTSKLTKRLSILKM